MQRSSLQLTTVPPTSLVVPTLRGAVLTRIRLELGLLRERLQHSRSFGDEDRAIEQFVHILTTEILPGDGR